MTERERRRHELLQRLEELLGSDDAATLMEHLPPDRWNELATRADLDRFATKEDLQRFATKEDLQRFATKEDLQRFATKEDLQRFATKEDLQRFATKEDLQRFATKEDLQRCATKEDLQRCATKEDLQRLETRIDRQFASKADLAATRDELRREMEHLGTLLTERIDAQGYRLEALLRERIDAQTKLLFFSILAAVMTAAGLGFGAAVL